MPYKCPICGKVFDDVKDLDAHMSARHWVSLFSYFGCVYPYGWKTEEEKRACYERAIKSVKV